MLVGSLPAPDWGPSFPTLMVPTTFFVDVSSTVTIPEVSPPTHSCEPSGVRPSVSGPPDTAIVLVTVPELALITETWSESGSATYTVPPLGETASCHGIWPTVMVRVTRPVPALITTTVPDWVLVT